MDYLRQLFSQESFRSAVSAFIALPNESLMRLAEMDQLDEVDTETLKSLGVSQISLDALQLLRLIAREEGVEAVLDEVATLLVEAETKATLDRNRAELLEALRSSESALRYSHAQVEASSVFPTLMKVMTEVDFRATRDPISGEPGVLPLLSVRLVFDENVGGLNAVYFQVSVSAVQELISALQSALDDATGAAGNAPHKVIP